MPHANLQARLAVACKHLHHIEATVGISSLGAHKVVLPTATFTITIWSKNPSVYK